MNHFQQKVTAVLPARNCRRELAVCISALLAGDCPPQIIVVDDGSDDGTAQMVGRRWPSAVLLRVPAHTGFAHAANMGLRLVQTQYAFLIRPELQPGRSCVRRLLEALEAPGAENDFCAVPEPWKRSGANRGTGPVRRRQPVPVLAVPDGCAMYRMEVLEEIGWFDERHFDGLEAFDKAYEEGWFDKVVCTNLTYLPQELLDRPYFAVADMSKYVATIIDYFNHDASISNMKVATDKIHALLTEYNRREKKALQDSGFIEED